MYLGISVHPAKSNHQGKNPPICMKRMIVIYCKQKSCIKVRKTHETHTISVQGKRFNEIRNWGIYLNFCKEITKLNTFLF